jgi:hypothetical protein
MCKKSERRGTFLLQSAGGPDTLILTRPPTCSLSAAPGGGTDGRDHRRSDLL